MLYDSIRHKDPLQLPILDSEPIQTTFLMETDKIDKKLMKNAREIYTLLDDITSKKKYKRLVKLLGKFRQQTFAIGYGQPLSITMLRDGRKTNQSDYIKMLMIKQYDALFKNMYDLKALCYSVMKKFTR